MGWQMTQITVHLTKGVITDLYSASGINTAKTLIIQNVGAKKIGISINSDMSGRQILYPGSEPWECLIPGSAYAIGYDNADLSVGDEVFKPAGQQGEKRPIGLFWGMRAITQQNYIEANVKNGAQFYIHWAYPDANPIAGGASKYFLFQTGTTPVLFKLRIVSSVGVEVQHEIFSSPTVTDYGTQMTVANFAGAAGNATTVQCYKDATVSDDGTAADDEPEYYFGAESTPTRGNAIFTNGIERVLSTETLYLVKITNNDTNATARFSWFGTWYEGDTDLPRPDGELD